MRIPGIYKGKGGFGFCRKDEDCLEAVRAARRPDVEILCSVRDGKHAVSNLGNKLRICPRIRIWL